MWSPHTGALSELGMDELKLFEYHHSINHIPTVTNIQILKPQCGYKAILDMLQVGAFRPFANRVLPKHPLSHNAPFTD